MSEQGYAIQWTRAVSGQNHPTEPDYLAISKLARATTNNTTTSCHCCDCCCYCCYCCYCCFVRSLYKRSLSMRRYTEPPYAESSMQSIVQSILQSRVSCRASCRAE